MATRPVIKGRTPAQWFCLLGGAVLFVRGIVGFFAIGASFALPGEGWHNLFHLASGVLLFLAASQPAFAKPAAIGYGVIYIGLAIAGIVDGEDALGVFPVRTETHSCTRRSARPACWPGCFLAALPWPPRRRAARRLPDRPGALLRPPRGWN